MRSGTTGAGRDSGGAPVVAMKKAARPALLPAPWLVDYLTITCWIISARSVSLKGLVM